MAQSDYILVTSSHNLDDGTSDSDPQVHEEAEDASARALESQGISLVDDRNAMMQRSQAEDSPENAEPRDQFSIELMNEGGIEIIQGDEEDSFL